MRLPGACLLLTAALAFSSGPVGAAGLRAAVEDYVAGNQGRILSELAQLLSIPNLAADRENIHRNAHYLREMLARRGLHSEILPTDGNPLVYGEWKVPAATRTILFYSHYDGQPVDPSGWKQDDPFQPILREGRMEEGGKEIPGFSHLQSFQPEWRIYARSASDDKSPIVALCAALDALRAAGQGPGSNIRVILDGEEEAGSPNLTPAIGRYRDKFQADLMLILDGPAHPSGRPTLVFGARGIVTLELTVYGPKFALHSGHYGNWVSNPAVRLAQLLASMKDDRGRVTIQGFYDGIPPLTEAEREVLNGVPDDWEKLRGLVGVAEPDGVAATLQEALQLPTLNVRGLKSGYVAAQARTIIPSEATAAIDVRLVKETRSRSMVEKILAHIRQQGYHVVSGEPDQETRLKHSKIVRVVARNGTEAYRTDLDSAQGKWVTQVLEKMWGVPPVRIRTSGGTVPISPFIQALGFPAISVPTVNFDNNQHGENENLRLGHFWKAIVTVAALLAAP